ncbi:MAG: hypothetical protein RH860_11210 [Cytophagales bacterium]
MSGLFNKSFEVTLTDELAIELESVLTESYQHLKNSGYSGQANYLKRILKTVIDRDSKLFKKLVLARDLLGGAGSVLDVWIEPESMRELFDVSFNKFLNLTIQTGLTHQAVREAEHITRIR